MASPDYKYAKIKNLYLGRLNPRLNKETWYEK